LGGEAAACVVRVCVEAGWLTACVLLAAGCLCVL
jgi:hypothetical protein